MSVKKLSINLDKIKRLFKIPDNNTFYELKSDVVSIKQNVKMVLFYRSLIFLVLFAFSVGFIMAPDRLFLVNYMPIRSTMDATKPMMTTLDPNRYPITALFQFQNPTYQSINFFILLRLIGLYLVFITSLWWNYQNVSSINHRIKLYSIWFSIYLSFSIISGALLLGWINNKASLSSVLGVCSLNILLVILNYVYWIVGYILNKKIQPISTKNLYFILISYSAKLLSWIILFIFLDQLIKGSKDANIIFNDNKVINFINSLTSGLFPERVLLLFVLITLSIALFITSNLYTLLNLRLIFVKLINDDLKNKAYGTMGFCFVILTTLVFGIIKILALGKYPNTDVIDTPKIDLSTDWFWVVGVLLFLVYWGVYFFVIRRNKTPVVNNIYHSGSLLLFWAVFLSSDFDRTNFNTANAYTGLLIITLITLLVILTYLISSNKQSAGIIIGLSLVSIFIVASVFLITFNNTLTNNQNFTLNSLNSDLTINQILYALLIVVLSINFIYVIASIYFIYFFVNKSNIFNNKPKIKSENTKESKIDQQTTDQDSSTKTVPQQQEELNQEINNYSGVNS
ncbi:MSC_0624 family F1-like ATPase-associated membrane protein [Mycoplasma bradburyae]|uniref:MSC_0624 family F1-like ATPase-associated membrane protein n=1 Tax=Mycoplasma bradburyae TaxID=2963128 RepID=UPI0023407834|nr:hypothetical protein [Mycoplasma bradburyae]MDC4183978.1 hypothetical protein [Mycoplasma bradburyae]